MGTATVFVLSSLPSSSHQLLSSWYKPHLIYEITMIALYAVFLFVIAAVAYVNVQVDGCGCQLLINILLTLVRLSALSLFNRSHSRFSQLGGIPGMIHAFWVTMKADSKAGPRTNTAA